MTDPRRTTTDDDDATAGAEGMPGEERLSAEMREQIAEAYCDANVKCYDPTDIHSPINQACESRKRASQVWLTVTGVGMLLDDLDKADAEIARLRALVAAQEAVDVAARALVTAWDAECAAYAADWDRADRTAWADAMGDAHLARQDAEDRLRTAVEAAITAAPTPAAGARDGEAT